MLQAKSHIANPVPSRWRAFTGQFSNDYPQAACEEHCLKSSEGANAERLSWGSKSFPSVSRMMLAGKQGQCHLEVSQDILGDTEHGGQLSCSVSAGKLRLNCALSWPGWMCMGSAWAIAREEREEVEDRKEEKEDEKERGKGDNRNQNTLKSLKKRIWKQTTSTSQHRKLNMKANVWTMVEGVFLGPLAAAHPERSRSERWCRSPWLAFLKQAAPPKEEKEIMFPSQSLEYIHSCQTSTNIANGCIMWDGWQCHSIRAVFTTFVTGIIGALSAVSIHNFAIGIMASHQQHCCRYSSIPIGTVSQQCQQFHNIVMGIATLLVIDAIFAALHHPLGMNVFIVISWSFATLINMFVVFFLIVFH